MGKSESFILRGDICHTPEPGSLEVHEDSYLVCAGGKSAGIFSSVPEEYRSFPVRDTGGCLIIPGMVDLHIHAPQYAYHGTAMDQELLQWLYSHAFPEESKYVDLSYARRAYGMFVSALGKSATTRAVVFATVHTEATLLLMDMLERSGIVSYVGKVNMDRDAPLSLIRGDMEDGAVGTESFVIKALGRGYERTYPIITPRFIPSCTENLLEGISDIRRRYGLPVQSHLSENPAEVELVRSLMPEASFYGDAYDRFGLFGKDARTVMAHCIYSTDDEIARMRENGVWVAHCPDCNMNVSSGIAPVRRFLNSKLRVGLGTDVAGGHTESVFRAMTAAIQVSKLYWRLVDQDARPLTFPEAFYLATKGGGSFFGNVGSFETGQEFDALVLDDSIEPHPLELDAAQRLERVVYLNLDRCGAIREKYIRGIKY